MAEPEDDDSSPRAEGSGEAETSDFEALADEAAGLASVGEEEPASEDEASRGPGRLRRGFEAFIRWHPYIFLGIAALLAVYAWIVYPRPEEQTVPPPETFYYDGLDRLYRAINPDLPLVADTPADEALGARSAFLNLFVFHRENLRHHPEFINPHLLLAEANRILAEFNPAMARKYYTDASHAYTDAAIWETREDGPALLDTYVSHNFLDGRDVGDLDPQSAQDEIELRRSRRMDYIHYRQAEADINLGRPEMARLALEDLQRTVDGRRREELRRTVADEIGALDVPRRAFELSQDEYRQLDLLLARAYDDLGMSEQARGWYLRYLANVPGGRNHAFVMERLADISLEGGEVYRRVDPDRASESYTAAVGYYRELAASQSATREQHENAVLGQALANSRLADLIPAGEMTGVDGLAEAGRVARRWLEAFSGQPLPRRTLALPAAVGGLFAKPDHLLPAPLALPGVVGGSLSAMAGGEMATAHERRRRYLLSAVENYDFIANLRVGTEPGDRAAVQAARESWKLGLKEETEARLARLLDPLSSPELILAARLGLADVALDKGDLRRARMLLLGGYAHPGSLWLTNADADWRRLAARLGNPAMRAQPGVWRRIWETIPLEGREIAGYAASGRRLDDEYVNRFLRALNTMVRRPDFYREEDFPAGPTRNRHLAYLLAMDPDLLTAEDMVWKNRLLLEEGFPYDLSQRAAKDNIGFDPLPSIREIPPDSLLDAERVGETLVALARAWTRAAASAATREDTFRMLRESTLAYRAALDRYNVDPGEVLYELATNYEAMAEIREAQGNHQGALQLTTRAAINYYDVSLEARGARREMESLLAAGDAFFRSGRLEWTVDSQLRFLERFGYTSQPGTDSAMAVVRAENLLGRAYWFMGDSEKALESFRRNISRRVPDRFKSMYYIGRVLMDDGAFKNDPALLGSPANPLPELDRNGDPIIETALQAFNFIRQSQGINPSARAWRWATFDLAKLHYLFAERARRAAEQTEPQGSNSQPRPQAAAEGPGAWLGLYDQARLFLTEALERYPLRRNGGTGISVRVEPEDYADVMTARFEAEYQLANTLLVLADARREETLHALARAHLENLRDRNRYANALFDTTLDRFQLNSAVIREEIEGGNWDRSQPLPRSRLGDDEGPTRDPAKLRNTLTNAMFLLANEYFRAGDLASGRLEAAGAERPAAGAASEAAAVYYQNSYKTYQDIYDRFGTEYGPQCMVGMGDCLGRLGYRDDAANHYRMARNMAAMIPEGARPDGLLDIGPGFWGGVAEQRLRDMDGGYAVP